MQKALSLYIILVLIIFGCAESISDEKKANNISSQLIEPKSEKFILDSNKIVILPIDTSIYLIPTYVRATELTNQELAEVEQLLNKCLAPKRLPTREDLESQIMLSEYRRQYIPYINQKGEKFVWVNCFCADRLEYWKKTVVQVMDGGSCFFNVTINLTEKIFDKIRINGVA